MRGDRHRVHPLSHELIHELLDAAVQVPHVLHVGALPPLQRLLWLLLCLKRLLLLLPRPSCSTAVAHGGGRCVLPPAALVPARAPHARFAG